MFYYDILLKVFVYCDIDTRIKLMKLYNIKSKKLEKHTLKVNIIQQNDEMSSIILNNIYYLEYRDNCSCLLTYRICNVGTYEFITRIHKLNYNKL